MEGGNAIATITDKRMEPFTSDERPVWTLESATINHQELHLFRGALESWAIA